MAALGRHLSKVITHNTISLNGANKDFALDIELHYEAAERFEAPVR